MPNQQYGGRSSFFDTPAGRALTQVASGGGGGRERDVYGEGQFENGLFATMRPGLRNAVADKRGEQLLRELEADEPWVSHDPGNPEMESTMGAFAKPRDFYVDPRVARKEADRQSRFMEAMQVDDLEGLLAPGQTSRAVAQAKAVGKAGQEVEDYGHELEAKRYWDPMTHSMGEESDARKIRLATEPANIAARSRENVQDMKGDSASEVAQIRQLAQMLGVLPKVAAGGGFGVDSEGKPLPPPKSVSDNATGQFNRALGAPAQKLPPEVEAEIQRGLSMGAVGPTGQPATREEIIAHLQKLGRIR